MRSTRRRRFVHSGCAKPARRVVSAGFTLVEMVTALAVLGLLAMFVMPSFRELAASQRVQTAATDLQTSLLRARSEAVKQNADVTMSPAGSWTGGWVISAAGEDIDKRSAAPRISISGPASVSFRSDGRIAGATMPQFTVSDVDTSSQRCVQVRLSGQPVVKKAACS